MWFIWSCLAWFIGIIAGAFFVVQPLIIIMFGIPFTSQLKSLGVMRGKGPITQYLISIVVLIGLFALATMGINKWLPTYHVAYWIGVVMAFLGGIGKCGRNPANIKDYIETNKEQLDIDGLKSAGLYVE